MWKTSAKMLARLPPIPSSKPMSKRSTVSMFTPSILPKCGTSLVSSSTKVPTKSHSRKERSASVPNTKKLQSWMRSSISRLSKQKANRYDCSGWLFAFKYNHSASCWVSMLGVGSGVTAASWFLFLINLISHLIGRTKQSLTVQ